MLYKLFMRFILLIFIGIFIFLPVLAEEATILPSQIGIVNNVEYIDTEDSVAQTKQLVQIKIIKGDNKGDIIEAENVLTGNPYYDINIKKNMKLLLHVENTGEGNEYFIEDVMRSNTLLWLSLLFCILLIYVGKKKGLYSLVSICLTVLIITNCLSPLILLNINPVFAVIACCILSTAITMYMVGGFNAKSTSALFGTVLSLIFSAILSSVVMVTAHLTGFSGEETSYLYSAHPELNFIHITVAGMILATMGAVMDVAMSISSTINEIHLTDGTKTVKELFVSGMNVGRDIIGTMANTLILVYIGGSLPLLLLAGNVDLQKFINLNQVVTEVASALIGSIAIVICVPFTAVVASALIYKYAKLAEIDNIKF